MAATLMILNLWNALSLFIYFLAMLHSTWDLTLPNQGSNPRPLHWKCEVLSTGLSGKYDPENQYSDFV